MEQVNSLPHSMPPGMGLLKGAAINWKRTKHWALTRKAKRQDEVLKVMRERLARMKPEADMPLGMLCHIRSNLYFHKSN